MNDEGKKLDSPTPNDPPGTRYFLDKAGNIVRDRRSERSRLRNFLIYLVLGLLVIVAAVSVWAAINQAQESDQQDFDTKVTLFEIRENQRDNCDVGGNTLRGDIRREFVDLKEAVLIPAFAGVAKTVPEETTVRAILDEAAATMRTRIDTIRERIPNNDCQELYPLLDDPRTEDVNEEGT